MELRKFPAIGESCYFEQLENGLPVFVVPKPGYSKAYAAFVTSYGGMHRRFTTDTFRDTPGGIAHYLEHKMFDMKNGNALQTLSAAGASPNAFTASDITAYYFSCTEHFAENLRTLLQFVSTPYFTVESVKKEQGIIGQEIGMVEDNPDWCIYQNLLQGLYHNHPIRHSIIGTKESISEITAETLYECHKAFYHPGNMVLCVAGDVDPRQVISMARMTLTQDKSNLALKDYGEPEPMVSAEQEKVCTMEVSAPNFLLGFKAEPYPAGKAGLRREILADLSAELLCGRSSPLYARLYQEGLINKTFSVGASNYPGAAFLVMGGESADPHRVRDAILEEAERLARGLDERRFRRALRAEYGAQVRSLNSFDDVCIRLARGWFNEYHYYDFAREYEKLTVKDVCAFLKETVQRERSCLSVVSPKGA